MEFIQTSPGISEVDGLLKVRVGVMGRELNRIDYSISPDEVRFSEKLLLRGVTDVEEKDIVMLNQVHGDDIVILESPPEDNLPFFADADGIITNLMNLCLVIRTADCVPVFAVDVKRNVLGAAHSGWRGCRKNITGKLIGMMKEKFGCTSEDMKAFILPSIGPESYRVNGDVSRFFPYDTISGEDGLYVNLWKNVETSLRREGVRIADTLNAGICTLRDERYFSHRRGDAGRNLNFAYMIPA